MTRAEIDNALADFRKRLSKVEAELPRIRRQQRGITDGMAAIQTALAELLEGVRKP